jgi:hypothetical protein
MSKKLRRKLYRKLRRKFIRGILTNPLVIYLIIPNAPYVARLDRHTDASVAGQRWPLRCYNPTGFRIYTDRAEVAMEKINLVSITFYHFFNKKIL